LMAPRTVLLLADGWASGWGHACPVAGMSWGQGRSKFPLALRA
jgi:hypothetical protein